MSKPRLRDYGYSIGVLPTGPLNAITDVQGVRVGHVTLIHDEPRIARTGVTAIHPLESDYCEEVVFSGFCSFNGFGEVAGAHWIRESGILSSPICISSAFSIGVLRDALLAHPFLNGWSERFHQPTVAETYDGLLNDGMAAHVTAEHVYRALDTAVGGPVAEGNVGGGTGMICHEFKGGIGTSSRVVENNSGEFTLGVLVQANYGLRQNLMIDGVPVGRHIGRNLVPSPWHADEGSIIIVVATDAPLVPSQCARLARRATQGLGRVGGHGANTSGDLVISFSTGNRLPAQQETVFNGIRMLPNADLTDIFSATVEATEESIVNALVSAETMTGFRGRTAHQLPMERVREIMERYGRAPAA